MGPERQPRERYEALAREGDPDAMCRLAILLSPSDPDEAVRWYTRAAELGHRGSMYNLGAMVQKSQRDEARKWWARAAALEDPGAMFGLGRLAEEDGDADEASRWFDKAEDTGDPLAANWLALRLESESPDEHSVMAREQAALFRVAMAIAGEANPVSVFHLVSEEAARLLGADIGSLARFESETELVNLAAWAEVEIQGMPPYGARQPIMGAVPPEQPRGCQWVSRHR